MKQYDHMNKFFSAILIGIFGAVLLIIFFAGMMSVGATEKLLPYIIGFNAALTGYNFISRVKDSIRYKRVLGTISGIILVTVVVLILNIVAHHYTGGYIVYLPDFLFLIILGGVFSYLGAILAIRYFKL